MILRQKGYDSSREFAHFERLISHARCLELHRLGPQDADILQGTNVYRAYDPIVEIGQYRGVKSLVGYGHECAGVVQLTRKLENEGDDSPLHRVLLADSFIQVATLWLNLMTDVPGTAMFMDGKAYRDLD